MRVWSSEQEAKFGPVTPNFGELFGFSIGSLCNASRPVAVPSSSQCVLDVAATPPYIFCDAVPVRLLLHDSAPSLFNQRHPELFLLPVPPHAKRKQLHYPHYPEPCLLTLPRYTVLEQVMSPHHLALLLFPLHPHPVREHTNTTHLHFQIPPRHLPARKIGSYRKGHVQDRTHSPMLSFLLPSAPIEK